MKTVYCLGPDGSYSAIIAKKMYPEMQVIMCDSFFSVVSSLEQNEASIALLPVENSITSDVHENIDYLFSHDNLKIMAEGYLIIDLNLIGILGSKIADITTVYSHPKALAQTSQFFKKNNISTCEARSTSEGKKIIIEAQDIHKACVGSVNLISGTNLIVLKENIGNFRNNMTRFLAITSYPKVLDDQDSPVMKGSYIFTLRHEPGTLAQLLTQLAEVNVNLTKIESRPLPGTEWEYLFLIDIEIKKQQKDVVEEIFQKYTSTMRSLGIYKKGSVYLS